MLIRKILPPYLLITSHTMNNLDFSKVKTIDGVDINISLNWKWAIEIKFDIRKEIKYFDLYLTLKSYAWNNIVPCYSIAFGMKDEGSSLIICEKENISKIKKINYLQFQEWVNWRVFSDKKYNTDSIFYYILLNFESKIIKEKNIDLDKLLPIYPWKNEWMDFLRIDENRIEYLENKLKNAELKIEKLEQIIKNQKKI